MYGFFRSSERITVFACDCSKDILEKANEIISNTKGIDIKDRFHPFLMDVSKETFPDWLFCKACQSSLGKTAAFLLGHSFCFKYSFIWVLFSHYQVLNSLHFCFQIQVTMELEKSTQSSLERTNAVLVAWILLPW